MSIKYNLLNLPSEILFENGSAIFNIYAADARKLSSYYATEITQAGSGINSVSSINKANATHYVYNFEYFTIIENGVERLDKQKIHNVEGYFTENQYFYYRKDHLGNNREVWNASINKTVQITNYYASGLMWDYPITAPQPYTYNGKEFIDYGFDVYDYGFRGYYAATGRFTSIDPMCEKTYAISPYAYASNNPVNNIDFMGLWTCGTATQTSGNFSMSNDIYVGVDISEFVENEDVLVGNSDLSLYDLFTSGLFGGGGRRYFNHYEKYRRFYFY